MLYMVTGGSGSGKSEFAENLAVSLFRKSSGKEAVLYYLATMHPYDEESRRRIERHRRQRAGKGFTTIECPVQVELVQAGKEDVVLLEDLSNLLANEMYLKSGRIKERDISHAEKQSEQAVLFPLLELEKQVEAVIIVTNEIFSDCMEYDGETKCYMQLLGRLNQKLSSVADGVVEVVCGIPLWHRGEYSI